MKKMGHFKNHLTKHRHVCTHFDAFSKLIPNMDMNFNNSGICYKIFDKLDMSYHAIDICVQKVLRVQCP